MHLHLFKIINIYTKHEKYFKGIVIILITWCPLLAGVYSTCIYSAVKLSNNPNTKNVYIYVLMTLFTILLKQY